jgi:tRNA1Val (adenine37-N6)-methyltransferase
MKSSCFHFRKFDVYHDLCAMKVGTDGVLLGAWVNIENSKRILDAGTGSGLIALMLAQRSDAKIDAVEIDTSGYEQAKKNVALSPWADRINVIHSDLNDYNPGNLYDVVVSNPPFFRNSLKTPKRTRNLARHDISLSWEQLIKKTSNLLTSEGRFSVILPIEAEGVFDAICWESKLYITRRCEVSTTEGGSPKRLLMEFSFKRTNTEHTRLAIETADHHYTTAFETLTSDFYL